MTSSWTVVPLGELVEAARGISYGVVQPGQHAANGVPLVRVTDIREGRIATADPLRIAPDIEAKYQRSRLRGGEILLTLVGTVGQTAIVPPDLAGWNTARAVAVVPLRDPAEARWVRFALSAPQTREFIDGRLNTTVQATLNLRDVALLPIPFPDGRIRRGIVEILGALDDKIELNRRTNETLEAMARALFDEASSYDAIEAPLPDLVDFQEGPGILARDFRSSGVPLIRLAGLSDSATTVLAGCDFLDPAMVPQRWSHFSLRLGDVLLSTSASLGRIATVGPDAVGAIPYTGIIRMRPKNDQVSASLIPCVLRSRQFQQQVEAMGVGSVIRHFGPSHLKHMTVRVPVASAQRALDPLVTAGSRRIEVNRAESRSLTALRDALLPKLLSGELRVPEAERIVGKAV